MKVFRLLMSGILVTQCIVIYAMLPQENESNYRLLFLEMDVTHLDSRHGSILSIAALLTDEKLNIRSELYEVINNSCEVVASIDPYLKPKYVSSGLRHKVLNSEVSLQQANNKLVAMLNSESQTVCAPWLVGSNSIALYHEFLKQKLPEVNRLVSYKKPIHIPSLRASALLFNQDDTFSLEKQNGAGELAPQTSLDIVRSLLNEYKYYKTRYFNNSFQQQTFDPLAIEN